MVYKQRFSSFRTIVEVGAVVLPGGGWRGVQCQERRGQPLPREPWTNRDAGEGIESQAIHPNALLKSR